jgi:5-methylcytosine-specific restriction endonuclease McrA
MWASLLIACLIPLYIFKNKIFKSSFRNANFDLFLKDLRIHLKQHHPKINFDFSIVNRTKDEPDLKVRETIIVENIVEQYFFSKYEKKTQKPLPKDKLWSGYEEKSQSNSKYPSDWIQRKDLVWQRDNKCCDRCGDKIIQIRNAYTQFVKEINNGGGYNAENIILVCQDCNQILNSTNPKNTIFSLNLYERLMLFVKS